MRYGEYLHHGIDLAVNNDEREARSETFRTFGRRTILNRLGARQTLSTARNIAR
jgi:hypothetical protein